MPRLKWTNLMVRKAREMAEQGATAKEVAEKLGITHEQARQANYYYRIGFVRRRYPAKPFRKQRKSPEEISRIRSEAAKRRWQNPDYRAKQREAAKHRLPVSSDLEHAYRVLTRKAGYSRHDALMALQVSNV